MTAHITPADIKKYQALKRRCDFDLLHQVLYAGSWPLPEFLIDISCSIRPAWKVGDVLIPASVVDYMEKPRMFDIQRLNRLKKTGWLKIQSGRLWLTQAGINAAPVWLEYSSAEDAKRYLKSCKIPVLKHRIPWIQRACLILRGEQIKRPLEKWFDPALVVLP